ncbi:S-formylglutathione hydrolase FrmB [Pedobacter africanus]|uniref:S-formylglutathione hydrolase FrmB n=1 Tax=Pedobacter africanus TaxID=151894 RepID=A0ACC6L1X1_9SPHI|nr:alpha/beta hydrolase family protein [Pedobacter africanus]MDR6785354.1 S-formylglutathione hydrolase FrmB [Pedobacter africanus]
MSRSLFVWCLVLLFGTQLAFAAKVDTVQTYSASMKKNIKAVVVTPDKYSESKNYPVVYILHGAGGSYANWITKVPALAEYADLYQTILVCPDGNVTSWYFDSPVDPAWKYETYVATELVNWIDSRYKTIKDRKGRAITGLSMGGHGALYLSFRHQDVFGAAGSMSGGVDFTPFPLNWNIAERLGTYSQFPQRWKENTIVNMTHLLVPKRLALIIDCGKEDFFYHVNMKLHEELQYNNIPHDFIIRPGTHNWEYWTNAIKYQLLYFNDFFNKK